MTGRFAKLEKAGDRPSASEVSNPKSEGNALPGAEDYPSFLLQADEAFFTGRYRDALRHYSRALQQENSKVYPWIGQISSLLALRQFQEAELWSNRALEQFPEDSSLLSQRARVLGATGNIKRALGVIDYAMARGATMWTWLARGEVLLNARDHNALSCFEKAVEEAGRGDWRVPLLAGIAFSQHRQYASAEDFLRRASEANPRNYFIWFKLAETLHHLGSTDRAQDAITRCLQLQTDYKPARDLEARLYRRPLLQRIMDTFRR